jgi:hypothetical protein
MQLSTRLRVVSDAGTGIIYLFALLVRKQSFFDMHYHSHLSHLQVACVGGHLGAVEVLLRYKARKNKLNFLKEKPGDCIGKSKHPREIREALGVPLKPPTAAAAEEDMGHTGLQGAHDEEDDLFLPSMRGEAKDEPRGAPYGGIPSGRSSGRPPIGGGGGGAGAGVYVPKYERGNNFSTDSYSERSYQEEKSYR